MKVLLLKIRQEGYYYSQTFDSQLNFAHTQLTYENTQIYMYTFYQPSLLKIQGQNQRVSLQVTVGLLVWFGQNVEFSLLHYIQQKKLNF